MGAGASVAAFAAGGTPPEGAAQPFQISTRFEPPQNEYSRETAVKLKEARSLVTAQIWTEEEFQQDKKSLLSGGASVLDDAKFEAADEVQQGISVVAYGFRLNSAMVVPVGPHCSSEVIFDLTKLRNYTRGNFHKEPRAEITKIEESSLEAFANSLEASVTVSGEAGFSGGSVSGSLSAELNLSSATKQSSHYIQHRKSYVFGHVILPGTALGFKKIQDLMDADTLAAFKAVDSDEKAKKMVHAFGPFFISSAIFGCLATYTSITEKKEGESAATAGLAVEAAAESAWASGSVEGSVKSSADQSNKSEKSKVTIRKLGGEPLNAGTESAWLATAATSPVIIKYSLKTIDTLLEPGTPAAEFLKNECDAVRAVKMSELDDLAGQYDVETTNALPPGKYEFSRMECGEERFMRANLPSAAATVLVITPAVPEGLQHMKKGGEEDSTFQWIIDRVTGNVVTIYSAYALAKDDCGLVGCLDPHPKNSSDIFLCQKKVWYGNAGDGKSGKTRFQWKVTKHDERNQKVSFQNVQAGLYLNSHNQGGCHMWRHEQEWTYKKLS